MRNIAQASELYLDQTLGTLDRHKDYVFWIRDGEMTRQIYQGKNFATLWQRDAHLVVKFPLLWLDYLEDSGKEHYMQQLQQRHDAHYHDPELNLIYYQIKKPNGSVEYIMDNCFKCVDAQQARYVVGLAKKISSASWDAIHKDKKLIHQERDKAIEQEYLNLLNTHFLIVPFVPIDPAQNPLVAFQEKILVEGVSFSHREIECIYYLCQGKITKEIAKIMSISPRTVEGYIEQVLIKSNTKNRMELIGRFSRYMIPTP